MSGTPLESTRIGNLVVSTGTWSSESASPEDQFEYIDISSINRNSKTVNGTTRITKESAPSRARQIVKTNDVLVSTVRPNLNAVAIVPPELDGSIASTGFCVLRCDESRFEHRYLFNWIQTRQFIDEMMRRSTGASYPAVSDRIVKESCIPLPPLREQKRIADILDKADAIRHKRRQTVNEIYDLRRSYFRHLFGDVATNDREWNEFTVGDIGHVQLGRQRSPKYQSGKYTHHYMRVANVFEDRIDLSDVLSMDFDRNDFPKYKLEFGDILLNEGQSTELVGRPAMWRNELEDCCFQNTLVRFRANAEIVEPEYALGVFIEYLHRGRFANISSKTSNMAHLGASRFAKMPFPLPPIELQRQYARPREQMWALADQQAKAKSESDELFKSLVQRAFRGEL